MSEEISAQDLAEEGRTSVGVFVLPTGYLDSTGNLHREIELREMTGVEEDILSSKKTKVEHKLNKIMWNCVERIGSVVDKEQIREAIQSLIGTDRLWLLVRLRILSLGELFTVNISCPKCEKTSTQTVSLEDFKVTGSPDPMQREWAIDLPKSKKKCIARVLTGNDEGKDDFADQDAGTAVLLQRIVSINGKKPDLKMVKSLPLSDRQIFRNFIKKYEGDIDNSMEIICPHCQAEFSYDVEIGSTNFFFPSEISTL